MDLDQLIVAVLKKSTSINFDSFFLDRHRWLFNLVYKSNKDVYCDENYSFQDIFSKKDAFELEIEFFSSLKSKYKYKFISDCIRRKFVQCDPNIDGQYYVNFSTGYYEIRCNINSNKLNMFDLTSITHEYIHHISVQPSKTKKQTDSYRVYSEALSILGEFKFLDFLVDNDFSKKDVEIIKKQRWINYLMVMIPFLILEPMYNLRESYNFLLSSEALLLLNKNPFYRSFGKDNLFYYMEELSNQDFKNKKLDYAHPLGLIMASALHQYGISNEDYIELIETINILELNEFEKILPKWNKKEYAMATSRELGFTKVKK